MSGLRIGLIEGDGIGPEITAATVEILAAAGFTPEWVPLLAGEKALAAGMEVLPAETIESIRSLGVALKAPTTTPSGGGHTSANVQLRKALDLYANVRPAKSLPGVAGPLGEKKVDIIIVRENTEDLYAGIEFMISPDIAQAIKVITRPSSRRICRFAFEMARTQGRKKVTVIHKANIMKRTDGLFLEEFYLAAKDFPEMESNDIIIDNCCMQLVTRPEQFDVLVTENLYGDIVSDLCAGLVGGLGIAPGANIGTECAVFEAVHGSAPDIAGKDIANPTALLFSALMMLRHLGEPEIANKIGKALVRVFREGTIRTGDLGGHSGTKQFTKEVIRQINAPA